MGKPSADSIGWAEGFHVSEWTIHGGKLASAHDAYPHAPCPWLDLSTGINPEAWPGVSGLSIDWQRLPDDRALGRLEATAASHFGVAGAHICAFPGTEFGLRALRNLRLPGPSGHVSPGYGTHGVSLSDSRPFPYDQLMDEVARGGATLLANPTNPDGRKMAAPDVLALAHAAQRRGGWLIVDEAFADAHADGSIIPLLQGTEQVIVLRSFGKFFGLAGVRLGFAVGPAAIIRAWRDMIGSWPLSAAAIAIGIAAYSDTDWITWMRRELIARAAACDQVLRRHGLQPAGASPLFRLVDSEAAVVFDRLARQGILTRPFDYRPRWLRFGVPANATDLARLDAALRHG